MTNSLRRSLDLSQVTADPDPLSINVRRGQGGRASLTFRNRGRVAVHVRIVLPTSAPITAAPDTFELPSDSQLPVVITVEEDAAEAGETTATLTWFVEEVERPPVTIQLGGKPTGGLMANVARGLRRGPKGG